MQTASHILSIVAEARREIIGAEIYSSEFYRKERAAYLFFRKDKTKTALGLSYHPQGSGAVCLSAGKIEIRTGEKPFPFFQNAIGAIVTNVERLHNDRIIKIEFELSQKAGAVILEATGPAGNMWLLDGNFTKRAVLRNRKFESGDKYAPPAGASKNPLEELNRERLLEMSESANEELLFRALVANFGGLNDTLAREGLCRANINPDSECRDINSDDASS
ncbi:MAG: NFACT family protein, partial [candidate division Zixibacteria bacterium]|nr:NFACT family protein [candidate division Zixibacteria bacterium]